MKYVIPGNPIALSRPRFGTRKVYDSQKNEKLITSISLRNQHGDNPLETGCVLLNVTFYMPVAPSRAKFRDSLMGTYHYYTPDISNLIKYVEDCANGIIFKDDSQIVIVLAKKIYGDPARTEFSVVPVTKIHSKEQWLQQFMEFNINLE